MSLDSLNTAQPPLYKLHLDHLFQRFPRRLQSKAVSRGLSISDVFKEPPPLVADMILDHVLGHALGISIKMEMFSVDTPNCNNVVIEKWKTKKAK